jgi:hypothetical protein
MKGLLIAVVGAVLLVSPARAQSSAQPHAVHFEPVTVVRITGHLAPAQPGNPPLPFDVLAQLERDPFLAGLTTEPRSQTGPGIVLTYSFPNVQAYRAWAETSQTRQLLDVLRQRVSQFELTVSLIRSQSTMILPGN